MSDTEPIVVDFDLDHDGRYHRVQVDGSDLVSIEDNGDGSAFVMVYDSSAEGGNIAWSGGVRVDGHLDDDPDQLVTCRECSAELPSDKPCENTEDGEHEPDMEIHEPPTEQPTRQILVGAIVTVPNDGYDYRVDVGGRLERVLGHMLNDRLVTAVQTSGESGSGWVQDVD